MSANANRAVADWNARHSVGTAVEYREVKGGPVTLRTTTRSDAWVLSGHTAVVMLTGKACCVCLDHCTVVQPPTECEPCS